MISETILQRGQRYRVAWYRSDAFTWRVTLRDADGDPVDLTGLTIALHAKINALDAAVLFTVVGAIVGAATAGIVDFVITATHTANVRNLTAEVELNDGANGFTHIVFDLAIQADIA